VLAKNISSLGLLGVLWDHLVVVRGLLPTRDGIAMIAAKQNVDLMASGHIVEGYLTQMWPPFFKS
jgi:hypothetical protein